MATFLCTWNRSASIDGERGLVPYVWTEVTHLDPYVRWQELKQLAAAMIDDDGWKRGWRTEIALINSHEIPDFRTEATP